MSLADRLVAALTGSAGSFRETVAEKRASPISDEAGVGLEPGRRPEGGLKAPGRPSHELRLGALAILCISLLIVSLDSTILNVALPVIARDLKASSSELQWIVDSYTTVFAGLLLVLGSLGDRFGRKWILLAGLTVFGAGSCASAFATSPAMLIATRGAMGIGGAAIMPSTLSLLTSIFTEPADRARAIGLWSGTTGLGVAIGPVVGGWLLAHYWWGSVLLVNVPIAAIGIAAAWIVIPNSRDEAASRPDPLGALLSTIGMAALLFAIIEAPSRSWSSPVVLAALAGGIALLSLFGLHERRSAHPMLKLSFFSSRRFSVAMAAMGLVMFALMGGLFLFTQYLQFSLGFTPLEAGLRIFPVAGTLIVLAPLSTLFTRRLGTKPVVFTGMVLIAGGLALLSSTTAAGGYGESLPGFLLIGAGAGLSFAPCTDSVMGSLPPSQTGIGSATNGAALQTGGALGVGVLGSLLNGRYAARIGPVLVAHKAPVAVASLVKGSLGGAIAVAARIGGSLGAALAALAREAFLSGYDLAVSVAAVVVAIAALVIVFLLPNRASPPRSWSETTSEVEEPHR